MTPTGSVGKASWHIANLDSPIDGIPIRFAVLKPARPAAQAVLFLNGRSEWIEKYLDLPDWVDLGDDTLWITMDHRGQGESGGPRAYVESYDDYVTDAAAVLEAAAPDLPYAIVSHSMGGLIALYGTMQEVLQPKALALSSPLFCLPNAPLPRTLSKPLARMIAKTRHSQQPTGVGAQKRQGFVGNPLTSFLPGFKLVQKSPFPYVSPSFGWIEATFAACETILDINKIKDLKIPVRILGSADERVIDPAGWSDFCLLAGKTAQAPIEFFRLHGGRHELLNEIPSVRNEAVRLIRSWLQRYLLQPGPE